MAFPDSWGPFFFISLQKKGGSAVELADAVDLSTLEINEGDFPGEGLPNAAGGRVWKQEPQEDGEITLELWAQELDITAGRGLFQQFYGSDESSEPLSTGTATNASVAQTRDVFQVVILFTNDSAATSAGGATAGTTDSLRFVVKNCRIISHKPTMSDGVLKVPITLKFPAKSRSGSNRNAHWDSGDQTALDAVPSFT